MVKKLMGKLPLAAVVVGLALSSMGCETLKGLFGDFGIETEQTKLFLESANDIILAKDDGMIPSAFRAAFLKKFSGVTTPPLYYFPRDEGSSTDNFMHFLYKDRTYIMRFSLISTDITPDAGPRVVHQYKYRITSAIRCLDQTKDKKSE